jgi:hypothetical protein
MAVGVLQEEDAELDVDIAVDEFSAQQPLGFNHSIHSSGSYTFTFAGFQEGAVLFLPGHDCGRY